MEKYFFNEWKNPSICTPLTGKTTPEIVTELLAIEPKKPDLLEWRADFFTDLDKLDCVLSTIEKIHSYSNGIPLLVTIRSQNEGGQEIQLSENEKVELLNSICQSNFVNMIDYEMCNEPTYISYLKEAADKNGKKLVLSYHNFKSTPSKEELIKKLYLAEFYGANLVKIAVMPQTIDDVFSLLEVTRGASKTLQIPVITISMGELGVTTRILGWLYGSVITFAVGEKSSAPGQIPIEELREAIETIKKLSPTSIKTNKK